MWGIGQVLPDQQVAPDFEESPIDSFYPDGMDVEVFSSSSLFFNLVEYVTTNNDNISPLRKNEMSPKFN